MAKFLALFIVMRIGLMTMKPSVQYSDRESLSALKSGSWNLPGISPSLTGLPRAHSASSKGNSQALPPQSPHPRRMPSPPHGCRVRDFWVITKETDGPFHGYLVPLWGSDWHFLIKLAHWSLIKVSSSWAETKGKIDPFFGRNTQDKKETFSSPLILKRKM